MEEWKDIKGYEGLYQVSNLGNVKSLNYNHTGKPRNLRIKVNKRTGNSEVKLSKKRKNKRFYGSKISSRSLYSKS